MRFSLLGTTALAIWLVASASVRADLPVNVDGCLKAAGYGSGLPSGYTERYPNEVDAAAAETYCGAIDLDTIEDRSLRSHLSAAYGRALMATSGKEREALRFLANASALGHGASAGNIGFWLNRFGTTISTEEFMNIMLAATANAGEPASMRAIAHMKLSEGGISGLQDAYIWFEKAIVAGDVRANWLALEVLGKLRNLHTAGNEAEALDARYPNKTDIPELIARHRHALIEAGAGQIAWEDAQGLERGSSEYVRLRDIATRSGIPAAALATLEDLSNASHGNRGVVADALFAFGKFRDGVASLPDSEARIEEVARVVVGIAKAAGVKINFGNGTSATAAVDFVQQATSNERLWSEGAKARQQRDFRTALLRFEKLHANGDWRGTFALARAAYYGEGRLGDLTAAEKLTKLLLNTVSSDVLNSTLDDPDTFTLIDLATRLCPSHSLERGTCDLNTRELEVLLVLAPEDYPNFLATYNCPEGERKAAFRFSISSRDTMERLIVANEARERCSLAVSSKEDVKFLLDQALRAGTKWNMDYSYDLADYVDLPRAALLSFQKANVDASTITPDISFLAHLARFLRSGNKDEIAASRLVLSELANSGHQLSELIFSREKVKNAILLRVPGGIDPETLASHSKRFSGFYRKPPEQNLSVSDCLEFGTSQSGHLVALSQIYLSELKSAKANGSGKPGLRPEVCDKLQVNLSDPMIGMCLAHDRYRSISATMVDTTCERLESDKAPLLRIDPVKPDAWGLAKIGQDVHAAVTVIEKGRLGLRCGPSYRRFELLLDQYDPREAAGFTATLRAGQKTVALKLVSVGDPARFGTRMGFDATSELIDALGAAPWIEITPEGHSPIRFGARGSREAMQRALAICGDI